MRIHWQKAKKQYQFLLLKIVFILLMMRPASFLPAL